MSTKDLLDRIKRNPTTTRTRRVASSGSEQPGTSGQKETSTRVAKGVIRRRKPKAASSQARAKLSGGALGAASSKSSSSTSRTDRPPKRSLTSRVVFWTAESPGG